MLGVSNLNEAMQLRGAGVTLPILILGYTPPELTGILLDNDLTQTVYCYDQALALAAACRGLGKGLVCLRSRRVAAARSGTRSIIHKFRY